MKRSRDEVYLNPQQFKKPFAASSSSRAESYAPSPQAPVPQAPVPPGGVSSRVVVNGSPSGAVVTAPVAAAAAGSTAKLTTNDALTYLKDVKDMFQDQREKYDRFLDVMKDFKAQRVDTAGVIGRVKELFKGHPNLILGFNTFLPKGYEITLTDEEEAPQKRTVEFEEAISFVNKIKKRFTGNDHVYKSFLDILNMYRKEHKGITEVYQEVATLFEDHADLLDEFTRFLPDTSATASAQPSFGRHSLQRLDERSSAMNSMRQPHIEKQRPKRERVMGSHGERDLSVERLDLDDDKTVVKLHKEHKKENKDRRNRDFNERDPDNENNGDDTMHRVSDKRKSGRNVDDFGGISDMAVCDDKDSLKGTSSEFAFLEKVKERLRCADDYQAFLKCLNIYSKEIITRKELHSLVADLIGKYPDLMEGFNEFLERCERIDGFLASVTGKKPEGSSSKPEGIEGKDKEHKRGVEVGKEKDKFNLKYWGKSINELDLSDCERCTPSYRLLPEDYPIPSASQRSKLGAQVLNDRWVSVTSGSEDYSFKHMRRNQYEESLFRCEDDRFELDMLLEVTSSTCKRAEELLNGINNNTIVLDVPIRVEDHFTVLNIRCIERLYGDHGLELMEILRKTPSVALPVILTRLTQKQEEWTKCRSDYNKVWAEIYAKNHYKSLDHRSFYFKQQDSKNLTTKALVAEIKEMKENKQKEDDVILSFAAGSRHSIVSNLEYEYSDPDVHDDVYKIVSYSCQEVCSTKEQVDKVMTFWTTFLEPMMGVHSRVNGSVGEGASKRQTVKHSQSSTSLLDIALSPKVDDGILNQQKPASKVDPNMSPQRVNLHSSGRIASSGLSATLDADTNHGTVSNSTRANTCLVPEGNGDKPSREDMLPSEVGASSKSIQLLNGDINPCKNEKEEGELSPNGDFEDNFEEPKTNGAIDGSNVQLVNHEEIGASANNIADADDERSESLSETGDDDVSGSESAAEDHEEEEDGEHDDLDDKAESEGEVEHTREAHLNGEGVLVPQSERGLMNCKPLSKHVTSSSIDVKSDWRVFYGNDTFYVLFRLHQVLYERILSAKVSLQSSDSKWRTTKDENCEPYKRFMSSLFSLLDGSSDNTKFEDDCRSLIGNQSYVLFTLDKLIYKLVKQLQTISTDELDCNLLRLFEYEKHRAPEKYVDSVYYENVHVHLHEENIYRLECTSNPTRLTIQLMDDRNDKSEIVAVSVEPRFANYLHTQYLAGDNGRKESSAIYLKRNMHKYTALNDDIALYLATENVLMINGLECKMAASSSKISYVLDTEDFFMRFGRRRGNDSSITVGGPTRKYQLRRQRFRQFLEASR